MREKNFQAEFKEKNKVFGVFELKICKGSSLPFSALAKHQEEALLKISDGGGLYYKLPDSPVSWEKNNSGSTSKTVRFTREKPFDCFNLSKIPAYVVVMFYKPRIKKAVYYIPVQAFIEMRRKAGRKSLTEDMARGYSDIITSFLGGG